MSMSQGNGTSRLCMTTCTVHRRLPPECLATSTSPLRAKCGVDPHRQPWRRTPTQQHIWNLCCLIHTAPFSAREDTIIQDGFHTCELVRNDRASKASLALPTSTREIASTTFLQTEDVGVRGGSNTKGPFGTRLTKCHPATAICAPCWIRHFTLNLKSTGHEPPHTQWTCSLAECTGPHTTACNHTPKNNL